MNILPFKSKKCYEQIIEFDDIWLKTEFICYCNISDKSIVVCAPTGSGKTVIFEMAIVQLLMELEDKNYTDDFKIIYSKYTFSSSSCTQFVRHAVYLQETSLLVSQV